MESDLIMSSHTTYYYLATVTAKLLANGFNVSLHELEQEECISLLSRFRVTTQEIR